MQKNESTTEIYIFAVKKILKILVKPSLLSLWIVQSSYGTNFVVHFKPVSFFCISFK